MSQTLLILFYISLGILTATIGRGMLFPHPKQKGIEKSIFDVSVIAQGARNFIIWVPRIIRMTLVNMSGGISMIINAVAERLEAYRHHHEESEEEQSIVND